MKLITVQFYALYYRTVFVQGLCNDVKFIIFLFFFIRGLVWFLHKYSQCSLNLFSCIEVFDQNILNGIEIFFIF